VERDADDERIGHDVAWPTQKVEGGGKSKESNVGDMEVLEQVRPDEGYQKSVMGRLVSMARRRSFGETGTTVKPASVEVRSRMLAILTKYSKPSQGSPKAERRRPVNGKDVYYAKKCSGV
jgi:hypothetical protein